MLNIFISSGTVQTAKTGNVVLNNSFNLQIIEFYDIMYKAFWITMYLYKLVPKHKKAFVLKPFYVFTQNDCV